MSIRNLNYFFLFSLENRLKNLINQKVIKKPITWNLSLNQLSKDKTIMI